MSSAEILETADAAAWYAAEHHRALHDANALSNQSPAGLRPWCQHRRAVGRLRRRARLAGHLATQNRADHDQLLNTLVRQVAHTHTATPAARTDPGAALLDRLTDALHAHRLALLETARHHEEAAATRWWQPTRRELARLRADYAQDCMAAHWSRIQQVRAEIDHHVRRRLLR